MSKASDKANPPNIQRIRNAALNALGKLEPAGPPKSDTESRGLMLSSRTKGGRALPQYYLVYFLLVDLLEFPHMGKWEKSAWTIPVRYSGRLYGIEYPKFGVGVFAPTLDPNARMSAPPSEEAETDAIEIAALISKAVSVARPYFEWRAEEAARGSQLNVVNKSDHLFDRYVFFRDRFTALFKEAEARKHEHYKETETLRDGSTMTTVTAPSYILRREADWNAQAAVEAFFSWSEHAFIHLAILQGRLHLGEEVADLAEADWKTKFKSALDIGDPETKNHYDKLLDLRAQIRNFMAHGAFGKRGMAFRFHSGTGAVPVLLTRNQKHRYALTGEPAFDERWAIEEIESFLEHLWSNARLPARRYVFSSLPSILSFVADGTYAQAMRSVEDMDEFVDHLTMQFDNAANMDW